MLSPLLRSALGLKPVPVTVIVSQSLGTWARADIAEITSADRPNLKPPGTFIFDNGRVATTDPAVYSIKPLVYGPLSGGGNEQQPANGYLDSAYQNGIGWLWSYFEEVRASGNVAEEYVFDHTIGGSTYVSTGGFGAAGNWTPSVSGSAYQNMLVEWNAFKARLAAQGKRPVIVLVMTDIGISTAGDASASTYQTDHSNMIAQLRKDVIGGAPVYQMLISTKHQPGRANWTTVRNAQIAMANADPTKFKLFNVDGIALEFTPNSPTDDHPVAGSLEQYGRQLGLYRLGISHPLTGFSALGDAIYPLRYWKPASLEAYNVGTTPWTDFPLHCVDRCGNGDLVALASGNVPTLQKTLLPNGITRRAHVFNGTTHYIKGGSPAFLSQAGGAIFDFAFNLPVGAGANRDFYTEDHTTDGGRTFIRITTDASGHLCVQARNDANVLLATTDLGVGVIADGLWHRGTVTWDKSNFKGYLDGVVGSASPAFSGTCTVNTASIGALHNNGSPVFFSSMTFAEGLISQYNSGGLSAYLAAKAPYFQRECGTP